MFFLEKVLPLSSIFLVGEKFFCCVEKIVSLITNMNICIHIYTYYHMLHVILLCEQNCTRNHKYADIYVYITTDYHRLQVNYFLQGATLGEKLSEKTGN